MNAASESAPAAPRETHNMRLDAPLLESPTEERSRRGVGVLAATISLVKTCIGTGVMALPFAFNEAGALALPCLLLLGCWNYHNCKQLLHARVAMEARVESHHLRATNSAYSAVVHAAIGRAGVLINEGSICVSLTLVCASLQVQAAQLMTASLDVPYSICIVATGCGLVPLVLLRSLNKLASVAAVSLSVLALSLLAVGAHGLALYGPPSWPPPAALIRWPAPHAVAIFFGIASFSFGLQALLMPVQDGMSHPQRASTAVAYASAVVVGAYAVIALLLAWIFDADPAGVQQVILLNLGHESLLASTVQLGSALVAVLSYPLPMMPVVQLAVNLIGHHVDGGGGGKNVEVGAGGKGISGSRLRDASLRIGLLLTTTLLALCIPQFGIAAGLAGCLTIVSANVLPPLCHLRLCSWPTLTVAQRLDNEASVLAFGERGPPTRRPVVAALDVLLLAAGCASFSYFTLQFVIELGCIWAGAADE